MTTWDERQIKQKASILQSSEWGQFQELVGCIPHYQSGDGWTCLALEKTNRIGKYLFAAYGPTLNNPDRLSSCIADLTNLAKQVGADWLRIEPVIQTGQLDILIKNLRSNNARPAVHDVNPALTRVLDLNPRVDELLSGISQSTRSLIRKNQRLNTITFSTSLKSEDMVKLNKMLDIIAGKKGIGFFSEDYFVKQAQVLMPAKMMFLEQAFLGKRLVAQAVIHDYGTTSYYTYAASLPEARKYSVSALLLWQSILNAKARGMKKIDLYGIAPDNALLSHPWYGFSEYKKKFGGEVLQTAGTWDIPVSSKYQIYRLVRQASRVLRGR